MDGWDDKILPLHYKLHSARHTEVMRRTQYLLVYSSTLREETDAVYQNLQDHPRRLRGAPLGERNVKGERGPETRDELNMQREAFFRTYWALVGLGEGRVDHFLNGRMDGYSGSLSCSD
jgi:hypothetical protein